MHRRVCGREKENRDEKMKRRRKRIGVLEGKGRKVVRD